jgi:SHS2 domain-containing protein
MEQSDALHTDRSLSHGLPLACDEMASLPPALDPLPQRVNRRQRLPVAAVNAQPETSPVATSTDSSAACLASSSLSTPLDDWAMCDAAVQYEHLDHTADVQLHSWGSTIEQAFEQQVIAMMSLITDLSAVEARTTHEVVVDGHDIQSLLFNFLDEWLFHFNSELFVCRRIRITTFDREHFRIASEGTGDTFELGRHEQGIEVKAITYSAMKVTETEERTDILVIVDI